MSMRIAICPYCGESSTITTVYDWTPGCAHAIGRTISGSGDTLKPDDTVTFVFERRETTSVVAVADAVEAAASAENIEVTLCPWHEDSLGWSDCSEGWEGRCQIEQARKQLISMFDTST